MLENQSELSRYVDEYPDQVYVNQDEFFGIDDYDVGDLGVAMAQVLDNEMPDTSGGYTRHQKCKRDCISWTALFYEFRVDMSPRGELYELAQELFDFVEEDEGQFTAVKVFMPFIRRVEHNYELLDSLHENLEVEGFYQVVVEGPTQNRFWIPTT